MERRSGPIKLKPWRNVWTHFDNWQRHGFVVSFHFRMCVWVSWNIYNFHHTRSHSMRHQLRFHRVFRSIFTVTPYFIPLFRSDPEIQTPLTDGITWPKRTTTFTNSCRSHIKITYHSAQNSIWLKDAFGICKRTTEKNQLALKFNFWIISMLRHWKDSTGKPGSTFEYDSIFWS